MPAYITVTNRCPALFTSAKEDWGTPQDLFDVMNGQFHFTTDVCATAENAKCTNYYSPTEDGLAQTWSGTCWMNPPYGKEIGKWLCKAHESSKDGATVVCLLPVRTDTKWWHDYVSKAAYIEFVKGRLKFGNSKSSAPFPSVIVVFAPEGTKLPVLTEPGKPVNLSILGGKFCGQGLALAMMVGDGENRQHITNREKQHNDKLV